MAQRSLQIKEKYKEKAENARISLGLNQNAIATRLGCSRQPVSRFFNCHSVSNELFVKICQILKLDWQEVAGIWMEEDREKSDRLPAKPAIEIDTLVTQLRQQVRADINNRCGTMRIFDMSQPIGLGKIYTQVNILEKITGRNRKEIAQLLEKCTLEDFNRFNLGEVVEEKISGEDAVAKYNRL